MIDAKHIRLIMLVYTRVSFPWQQKKYIHIILIYVYIVHKRYIGVGIASVQHIAQTLTEGMHCY